MSKVFIQGAGGGGTQLDELTNPASASDILSSKEAYDDKGTKIIGTYSVSANQPTLAAPTISRTGSNLYITNASSNGSFVSGYKIYIDDELVATQASTTYSLVSLGVGTHTIRVKAYATNFNDSSLSNSVSYTIYSITNNLTDLTTSNAATQIAQDNAYSATLTPAYGKYLPDSITVTVGGNAAIFTYDSTTGAISIGAANITGNIVITAVAKIYGKLATPTISLAGSVISWSAIVNATDYDIYYSGAVVATTTNLYYDLSTLFTTEGSYQVSVVARATNYTDSNASNTVTYNIGVVAKPIYGVSGLYNSTTALTRTDDAVGMTWAMSNNEISSDFDNVFPYNQMVRETINGNVFVKIPAMYWRIGYDANNYITDIAVSEGEMTAGANQVVVQTSAFYYGAYGASQASSVMKSVSGVSRQYSQTRATFRSQATANGTGYTLIDVLHTRIVEFLWLIEFADKNSENIMWGFTSYGGACGATDNLTSPSGQLAAQGRMRWRYIEDFIGNGREFFDGIAGLYVTANPSQYGDTTGVGTAFAVGGAGSGNELAALGIVDMTNPLLATPAYTVSNSSFNTYFCDGVYTTNTVFCRGRNYARAYRGLFCWRSSNVGDSDYDVGSRLLYQP